MYLRVSRHDVMGEDQLAGLLPLAAARGLNLVHSFEERLSGIRRAHPQYDAMFEAASQGAFKVLLLWTVDHLGSSAKAVADQALELDRLGVWLLSHQEPWFDTTGSSRPVVISMLGWMAEQERRHLSERTKEGMESARAGGKHIGRPKKNLDMEEALRLRERGLSLRDIAQRLNVSYGLVYRNFDTSQRGNIATQRDESYYREAGRVPPSRLR